MTVVQTNQSQDDINKEIKDVNAIKAAALNSIIPSLDLPDAEDVQGELDKIRTQEQHKLREDRVKKANTLKSKTAKAEEESNEEPDSDDTKEDDKKGKDKKDDLLSEDDSEDEDSTDEEEDELIPKSKVEKRFRHLTAEIRELKAARASDKEPAEKPADSDMQKLEQMNPDQLKQTLRNVRSLQIKIGNGEHQGDIDSYVDLEMKVHDAINSYGARFQNDQVKSLNKAIAATEYDEDLKNPAKDMPEIRKIADKLYSTHSHFRSTKDGMKAAWDLATEHYKLVQNNNNGKDETNRVKRENSKLKKKTNLDSSRVKGSDNGNRKLDLLRKKLTTGGTDEDKSEFVKESKIFNVDALLPDDWN